MSERTGTDLLMKVMQEFGEHGESVALLVVYANDKGQVRCESTCSATHSIGLAEYAKAEALLQILKNPIIGKS